MDIIDDRTKDGEVKYYQLVPGTCFYFENRPSDIFLYTARPVKSLSDIKLLNKIFAPSINAIDYDASLYTGTLCDDIEDQLASSHTANICMSLTTNELGFPTNIANNVVIINAVLHIKDQ